jgi:hypothetical protein
MLLPCGLTDSIPAASIRLHSWSGTNLGTFRSAFGQAELDINVNNQVAFLPNLSRLIKTDLTKLP